MQHPIKREREQFCSRSYIAIVNYLTLQLDLNDFERLAAGVFRQVGEGFHVQHRSCVRVNVFRPPVWVSKLRMGVRQEHSNRFRVTVHHGFFARCWR